MSRATGLMSTESTAALTLRDWSLTWMERERKMRVVTTAAPNIHV